MGARFVAVVGQARPRQWRQGRHQMGHFGGLEQQGVGLGQPSEAPQGVGVGNGQRLEAEGAAVSSRLVHEGGHHFKTVVEALRDLRQGGVPENQVASPWTAPRGGVGVRVEVRPGGGGHDVETRRVTADACQVDLGV